MVFEIHRTTAEHIISAVDVAMQLKDGADGDTVAAFISTTVESGGNALLMAKQLGFLKSENNVRFRCNCPYAEYLVTSDAGEKAAVLRFFLEQYQPYKTFKARLALGKLASDAANEVGALHQINAHRDVILQTLTNLGTYAQSLISQGAGLYRVREQKGKDYLYIVDEVISKREVALMTVRMRMGDEASSWINQQDVFEQLVTGYQRAAKAKEDARSPIVHAGNAVESFLSQVADHHKIDVSNATGINAKVEKLSQSGNLTTKHKFMLKYLGHIRNAADHGKDSEIGQAWQISPNTAVEYVHVAQSVIADVVAHLNGKCIV